MHLLVLVLAYKLFIDSVYCISQLCSSVATEGKQQRIPVTISTFLLDATVIIEHRLFKFMTLPEEEMMVYLREDGYHTALALVDTHVQGKNAIDIDASDTTESSSSCIAPEKNDNPVTYIPLHVLFSHQEIKFA